jgi:hypothetical protein
VALESGFNVSASGEDEAGELYGVDYGGGAAGQGKVRRLTSLSMRVLMPLVLN